MARYLPDNNLSYPVLVRIGNNSGSGFYFRSKDKLFFVTARHVLFDVNNSDEPLRGLSAELLSYDLNISDKDPLVLTINLGGALIRKNIAKDIALIELGSYDSEKNSVDFADYTKKTSGPPKASLTVVPPEHLKKFNDILVSNEVFILGYPNSLGIPGGVQIEQNRPLLRKGVIAGLNKTNETIILDCPVYFGNSGGLAIEVEEMSIGHRKFQVIGVVSEFIPFIEHLRSIQLGYTNSNFENSGYAVAVPIDTILDLVDDAPVPNKQTE